MTIDIVRKEISDGRFNIPPPTEIFNQWEENGILLLNTSLTCELNKPNSHSKLWKHFTEKTIEFIAKSDKNKHWLLFGNKAKAFAPRIEQAGSHNTLTLRTHPRTTKFVKSGAFKEVINLFMDMQIYA